MIWKIFAMQSKSPWQIEMFHRSLKKQQKFHALIKMIGDLSSKECLFVTHGDNNGALNWYFRAHGGVWTWADVSGENLEQIRELLDEPVIQLLVDEFPFPENKYDFVVSIDVLEHLDDHQSFLRETRRVLRPGGKVVVTVPNGDPALLSNRIKWRIGMTPNIYGHTRAGYTLKELRQAISEAGMEPKSEGGYSRFFTEILELLINYTYTSILSRDQGGQDVGNIAPRSSGELQAHGLAYRLYGLTYPIMNLFSSFDRFLPERLNNAVIIVAEK